MEGGVKLCLTLCQIISWELWMRSYYGAAMFADSRIIGIHMW